MKRLVLLLALLLPVTAHAQAIAPSPQGLTAQFSSTCAASTCATWQLGTATSVTVSVTGAGSWTGTFKASSDNGQTYFDATMIRLSDRSTTTTVSDTGDGQYGIVNSGITHLQFRLTTWASGGANVWAIRGYGSLVAQGPFANPVIGPASGTCVTPSFSFTGDTDSGLGWLGANNICLGVSGATVLDISANLVQQKNGTTAQTHRVFGTTTGSKYIYLTHDGTNGILDTSSGGLYLRNIGAAGWIVSGSGGELKPEGDNIQDLGTTGARIKTGYFGTSVVAPILQGSGTGVTVANVGANSCGTSPATIAGNQTSGVITVGATSGTQCRVTFSTAAPVARDCTVTDSTTTIATRATVVSTTEHDFFGVFVAGDNVTYICHVR